MKFKEKSGAVTIIGDNVSPVKVCDIKNGRPNDQKQPIIMSSLLSIHYFIESKKNMTRKRLKR